MDNTKPPESDISAILKLYGLNIAPTGQDGYINYIGYCEDDYLKIISSVLLENGQRVVIKILHEEGDLLDDRRTIESQSAFSEFMRQNGILTPKRYKTDSGYCNEYFYSGMRCNVTVEDWCGNEIMEIDTNISYKIGELMARMHIISLENNCKIGCGTLFSAAYENDVDAYEDFCKICENERLDQAVIEQIKKLRDEKIKALRAVWDKLPKTAVQGDISINNLVYGENGLIVFDYNNAGDEVLISDLVMEGLLTAYEMPIPADKDQSCREQFFPTFLKGYLSVRKLSEEEATAAWIAYTLYHSLWFTRIKYNDNSLEKLVKRQDYASANRLLVQMLADITEKDDGRFKK